MNRFASNPLQIQLDAAHLMLVQSILSDHVPHARVMAFGSRATGTPRKYSDLDLAIIQPEPLTLRTISRLKSAFEDSDLPICVDVVDWNQADGGFKAMVSQQNMVGLQG